MSRTDQTYSEHLESIGVELATLRMDEGGTVISDDLVLPLPAETTDGTGLVIGSELGRGGMGVVREARQRALDRPVAVKTVREDRDSETTRAQLHREAWITGHLQHPDIVPVYELTRDDADRPVMVMKLVEGVSWREVLENPAGHVALLDGRAALDFHLDVLDRVCRAVAYAHEEGVLHRDLKPENVMLGGHGEVLVVDWGIAVALSREGLGPVPSVRRVRGIAGTPGYMAPEMAAGDGRRIGVSSDVFLLGAVLHRVVTGARRHAGKTVAEELDAAWRCDPPELPDTVPGPLAELIRSSTARVPSDRPADVSAFRQALVTFRRERAARRLVDVAAEKLFEVEALLDGEGTEVGHLAQVATEARFALEQAKEGGARDERMAPLARQLAVRMCRVALDNEEPDAASVWLSLLAEPPERLVQEVGDLRQRLAERAKKFEDLSRDVDPVLGRRARQRAAMVLLVPALLGLTSAAVASSMGFLEQDNRLITLLALMNSSTMQVMFWSKGRRRHGRSSRIQALLAVLGAWLVTVTAAIGWASGSPFHATVAQLQVVGAAGSATLAVYTPRAWVAVASHALAVVAVLSMPSAAWWAMLCGSCSGYLGLVWAWSGRRPSRSVEVSDG